MKLSADSSSDQGKSGSIPFSWNKRKAKEICLPSGGFIPLVENYTHLGVIENQTGTAKDHVLKRRKTAEGMAMSAVKNAQKNLGTKNVEPVLEEILGSFLPRLTYGVEFLPLTKSDSETLESGLNEVLRAALDSYPRRDDSGRCRSESNSSLQKRAGVPSVTKFVQILKLTFLNHLLSPSLCYPPTIMMATLMDEFNHPLPISGTVRWVDELSKDLEDMGLQELRTDTLRSATMLKKTGCLVWYIHSPPT